MDSRGKIISENVKKLNTDKNLKRNKGIAKGRNRKMAAKKNLSEYRTTKQLLALALSNKFTDSEFQTMLRRSEEFKSIKFRKRVR